MNLSVNPAGSSEANQHPAEKFAGIYQFMEDEVDDSDSQSSGDMDKDEKFKNYKIAILDRNDIWFSDLGDFEYRGTFVLNETYPTYRYTEGRMTTSLVLQNNTLILTEDTKFYNTTIPNHTMVRVYELVVVGDEDYLIISDEISGIEKVTHKMYVRVPSEVHPTPITNTNDIDIPSIM